LRHPAARVAGCSWQANAAAIVN
jgi:hypothetical protein